MQSKVALVTGAASGIGRATLGIVFFALPFRLGRRFGGYLMSTSIVAAIGLPFMPSMALWLQGYIGYETTVVQFQNLINQAKTNPLIIPLIIGQIPLALGGLMAAIIISLVIFPFAYLFILSMFARSLANVLGGSASGPSFSRYIIAPSYTPGRTIAKELAD